MPNRPPRIGVLGIMQELYDDMLPGITERQAAYARELGASLEAIADVEVAAPARNRADIERVVREFETAGVDGLLGSRPRGTWPISPTTRASTGRRTRPTP